MQEQTFDLDLGAILEQTNKAYNSLLIEFAVLKKQLALSEQRCAELSKNAEAT